MNVQFNLAAEQSWSSRARKVGMGIAAVAVASLLLAAGSISGSGSSGGGSAASSAAIGSVAGSGQITPVTDSDGDRFPSPSL